MFGSAVYLGCSGKHSVVEIVADVVAVAVVVVVVFVLISADIVVEIPGVAEEAAWLYRKG